MAAETPESLADIAQEFTLASDASDRPDSETKGWDDDEGGRTFRAVFKRHLRAFVMGNVGGHNP